MLTGSFAAAHLVLPSVWALAAGLVAGWICAFAGVRYSRALVLEYGLIDPAGDVGMCAEASETPSVALSALLAAVGGAAAFLLYWRLGMGWSFLAYLAAVMALLVLAVVDSRTSLLPDAITQPLLWAGLLLAWSRAAWLTGGVTLHDALAGAAGAYGFLYGLFVLFRWLRRRDGMGHGDFKLAAALGAWAGWQWVPHILLLACVAGICVYLVRKPLGGWNTAYPFGPCLAAAGILALVAPAGVHLYLW